VNLVLRSNPDSWLGLVGVRLDARALFQRGVVSDGVHASPAFGVSAFVRF
jgi:hypothetical protein